MKLSSFQKTLFISLFILLFSSIDVFAQSSVKGFFGSEIGLDVTENNVGIGLNGKFILSKERISVQIIPVDLNFVPAGTKEGFENETLSDGRTICRNTSNGQFADKSNCATQFDTYYGFMLDLSYRVNKLNDETGLSFGLGHRLGDASTTYVTANIFHKSKRLGSVFYNSPLIAKIAVGKEFFELGLGISFSL